MDQKATIRTALTALETAPDFDTAQTELTRLASALGLPVLSWAPEISRPVFDSWMDDFMRRQGWSDAVLDLWWSRSVMLKSPLDIRCRTRSLPFVTDVQQAVDGLAPDARAINQALADMGLVSMITLPIHLPRGQVAQISFGGPLSVAATRELLDRTRTELVAAGQYFMHAFARTVGDPGTRAETHSRLTPREWECLRLTAQGHREAEVATLLQVKPSTVRFHLRNVERKLGATTRTHAVAIAAQLGLLGLIS